MAGIEGEEERMGSTLIKIELSRMAMKGEWDEVVKVYSYERRAHKAKITKSGDTALHIAVSDGNEDIVQQLITEITSSELEGIDALKIKNEQGNTPLHVAASMGSVSMCECIAQVDPISLVSVRNEDGKTPLFLAAVHGKKDAFFCLLGACGPTYICEDYSRRNDGETILHVAVAGEYFDLAFRIICLFENLVYSVNQHGFTPLHLLAAKPSAFRSGIHLGLHHRIIYHCILVDELKVEVSNCQPIVSRKNPNDTKDPCYPENYNTCANFFGLVRKAVSVVFGLKEKNGAQIDYADIEIPRTPHSGLRRAELFPPNYVTCFDFVKRPYRALLVVLALGFAQIRKIHNMKEKHTWSVQIMNELLQCSSSYEHYGNTSMAVAFRTSLIEGETRPYTIVEGNITKSPNFLEEPEPHYGNIDKSMAIEGEGAKNETTILIRSEHGATKIAKSIMEYFPVGIRDMNPDNKNMMLLTVQNRKQYDFLMEKGKYHGMEKRETPILIATKNGIIEIVDKILERFPVAIHDKDAENKNIVLLAVENRQSHVYQLLLKRNILTGSVFRVVDNEGNSALHLAAKLGKYNIASAMAKLQWEFKWYEFVKDSMPLSFFPRYNRQGKTPEDLFTETHMELVENSDALLSKTSESCSVIAGLIATVAFATSVTVPGGVNQDNGTPMLVNEPAFNLFAISSLVALCFSIMALVTFHVAILKSRCQKQDMGSTSIKFLVGSTSIKFLVGSTSLLVSIAAMLISFCAGHYLMLRDKLQHAAIPVYAVACLPITFYTMVQFPFYFDLIRAIFNKVPPRNYKADSL